MDTTDSGVSSLMLCGAEVVSFAGDLANQRHLDECCDCALMDAWWQNRIRVAASHMRKPHTGQLTLFVDWEASAV
jgi:hypothetical protein